MNNVEYLKKYYQGDITSALERLEQGEPIQYIVGNVDFYHSKSLRIIFIDNCFYTS